jgi:hypothetical protein
LPIGDPSIQCALAPMLPLVEAWPYPLDAEVWRQPNRSLVDVVELLPGKLDRPGASHSSQNAQYTVVHACSRPEAVGRDLPGFHVTPNTHVTSVCGCVDCIAETITVDEQGNLYFLEQGAGRITWAPDADLTRHELFANTGGSPLGGVVTATGDLVYADASKVRILVSTRMIHDAPNSNTARSKLPSTQISPPFTGADDGGGRSRTGREVPHGPSIGQLHSRPGDGAHTRLFVYVTPHLLKQHHCLCNTANSCTGMPHAGGRVRGRCYCLP